MRVEGVKCVLRDVRETDLDAFRFWLAPDQPWRDTNAPYLGRPDAAGVERAVASMAALAGSPTPGPPSKAVIADPSDDRLIGRVEWYWECEQTDWRRVGIALYDSTYRGRGVGREALALWTSHLFDTTDALRLDLLTYSGNVGMCRSAQAAGYVLEARLRKARRWSGGEHDAMIYAALREEWVTRRE